MRLSGEFSRVTQTLRRELLSNQAVQISAVLGKLNQQYQKYNQTNQKRKVEKQLEVGGSKVQSRKARTRLSGYFPPLIDENAPPSSAPPS